MIRCVARALHRVACWLARFDRSPRIDLTPPDDLLHPDGRCRCGGEGTCAWCLAHCLECGVNIFEPPTPCTSCDARTIEANAAGAP